MTDEFAYPTEDAQAARAAAADTVAERVRDMLRRCRLFEDPTTEVRNGMAREHYPADVRYLVGAIQRLLADRADLMARTESSADEASEYLRALRATEERVVQLTADLERARRG